MRIYHFIKRDSDGLRLPARQVEFPDDMAALTFADRLTADSATVDVWDNFRLVGSTFAIQTVFGREIRAPDNLVSERLRA